MRAQLAQAIELDEFLRFWASEKVLEHWDGYANNLNNFLLYRDPARERFVFIPSGTDQVTVPDPFSETKPPVSVYSTGLLANRLYAAPEGRQEYAAAVRDVLERAFRESELLAEVDRMQVLVTPVLARSGYDTTAHATAVEALRGWIRGRRGVLLADLQNGPPEWRQPLKQSFCVDLAGRPRGRVRHVVRDEHRARHLPRRQRGARRPVPPRHASRAPRRLAGGLRQERSAGAVARRRPQRRGGRRHLLQHLDRGEPAAVEARHVRALRRRVRLGRGRPAGTRRRGSGRTSAASWAAASSSTRRADGRARGCAGRFQGRVIQW